MATSTEEEARGVYKGKLKKGVRKHVYSTNKDKSMLRDSNPVFLNMISTPNAYAPL